MTGTRARVMLLSDTLRGLLVGIVALLAFAHRLELWHIYIVSLLFGIVGAFFGPAYRAIVPEIVPRELLPSANGLTTLSLQLAEIVGPALGALVVSTSGSPTAFTLDCLSFVISALCLAPLVRLALAGHVPKDWRKVKLKRARASVTCEHWLLRGAAKGRAFHAVRLSGDRDDGRRL